MLQKLSLYYHTIKYLKWIQIRYQLWYKCRNTIRRFSGFKYNFNKQIPDFEKIHFDEGLENYETYSGNHNFCFLNLNHSFEVGIDWDFPKLGKLWTYNLNYFEFLNQENSPQYQSEYHDLIDDFIQQLPQLKNANEPFPTSLRIVNWIKFILSNNNFSSQVLMSLYNQLYILDDNKEFHLLGNHLLENGFALVFGGVFFQDEYLFQQGKNILIEQLEEQILNDGAHFELSPMYHCLMLHRVLDILNLLRKNSTLINKTLGDQNQFVTLIKSKALIMSGWLAKIMYKDGTIPHFNDSTDGVALEPKKLLNYAQLLGLKISAGDLKDSGFRKLKNENFDIIIKAGNIGPDYIPGHAHADSLSFECRIANQPFIVDIGISTYEKNEIRQMERSTMMHNTVYLDHRNSSDVWGGFRVAHRASSFITKEDENNLIAYHNGYEKAHQRHFNLSDSAFFILDDIHSKTPVATYHFHPDLDIEKIGYGIKTNIGMISFEGAKEVVLSEYQYCLGFNKVIRAKKATVVFENSIKTKISL